jgi:hypothetical protein
MSLAGLKTKNETPVILYRGTLWQTKNCFFASEGLTRCWQKSRVNVQAHAFPQHHCLYLIGSSMDRLPSDVKRGQADVFILGQFYSQPEFAKTQLETLLHPVVELKCVANQEHLLVECFCLCLLVFLVTYDSFSLRCKHGLAHCLVNS